MATYTKTQSAKTAIAAVVTSITSILNTINTDASAPATVAAMDVDYAYILANYQGQLQKILDDLTKLEKNLSAG